jgi:hypothetical protein
MTYFLEIKKNLCGLRDLCVKILLLDRKIQRRVTLGSVQSYARKHAKVEKVRRVIVLC